MAKKFKKNKRKTNKIQKFWNKRAQDLTVGESVVYGLAASAVALGITFIPLAIMGAIENREPKVAEIPIWNLPKTEEATEEVDEEAEAL